MRHRSTCTRFSQKCQPPFELEVIFCVRGVASPLLANLYINRMLKGFRQSEREAQVQARIVNYADDFVILSRGKAREALGWTREVRDRLNQILRGWSAYFSYGTHAAAYDAVDNYVYESVRHFLRRRHQVHTRGTNRFSMPAVFGELGVLQLRRLKVQPRS